MTKKVDELIRPFEKPVDITSTPCLDRIPSCGTDGVDLCGLRQPRGFGTTERKSVVVFGEPCQPDICDAYEGSLRGGCSIK